MGTALDVVQQGFAAFGRRDIPAFLKLVADGFQLRRSPAASALTAEFLSVNKLVFTASTPRIRNRYAAL
jgi:ketosteroid isomerase-like protein